MKRILFFLTVLLTLTNGHAQAPVVNQPANQSVCNGASVPSTIFTGTPGARFVWANSNSAIGLAANGSGNLPAFTATNTGNTPLTGTITVTPGVDYAYVTNKSSNNLSAINTALIGVEATINMPGKAPRGVAITKDGTKAYVANYLGASVSVINTFTNTELATIPMTGTAGARDVAISPDGSKVYVANLISDNVSVINTADNTVTTITVGNEPFDIAITPDGSKVYVTNQAAHTVSVITTADNKVIITVPVGAIPQGVAVSPDGSKVYVANYNGNNVSVINTASNTVSGTIPLAANSNPQGIAVSPDGSKVYVTNYSFNLVSVINTANNSVSTIPVGVNPFDVAVTPDGSKVYVTNSGGANNVSVINTATGKADATITVGTHPEGLAITPDGSKVYVANNTGNSVSVISTSNNAILNNTTTGTQPYGVAVAADGSKVYVTNEGDNTVSVIDPITQSTLATIGVGTTPYGVAVTPDGSKVYVANYNSNTVSVINTADYQVLKNITVGKQPFGVAVSPDGSKVYVTNSGESTVSEINTATNTEVTKFSATGSAFRGIAVSPDGSKVYVVSQGTYHVTAVNTTTHIASPGIAVGTSPFGVVVSPDGLKAYVTNETGGTVSVINTASNSETTTITVGTSPRGIAITPDGKKVYVVNSGSNTVSIINTSSYTLAATVAVGTQPVAFGNFIGLNPGTAKTFTITVNPPTAITTQPTAAQTVCAGSGAGFSVVANGSGTVTYQWRKDGVNISNANAASYTIAAASAADAGTYDVVVTGDCGPVTSTSAKLAVTPATAISAPPVAQQVCKGTNATFSVTATGSNLTYQWRLDGTPINGATNATLEVASADVNNVGSYDVIVSGDCGPETSTGAALTLKDPVMIASQPASQNICSGGSASFSVAATGTGLTYQWRKDGNAIVGATSDKYDIASVVATDAGTYDVVITGDCGQATSLPATLTIKAAPSISVPPAAQTVCTGSSATFSVTASGDGLIYQWRKNRTPINGAITSTYTLATTSASDAGNYDVVITGDCGTATSTAVALTLNTAPSISIPPAAQTVCTNSTVTFSVTATGSALTYQWRKNGQNINGATNADYTIANATSTDAGNYDVVVTNSCSTATSSSATLTIKPAPAISVQPTAQTVCAGSGTTFSVTASGDALAYQWRKAGQDISGATNTTYAIASAAASDAASYDVVITNSCGTATSTAVPLNLKPAPVITAQSGNQVVCAGASATFSVTATGSNLTYQWKIGSRTITGANAAAFTIANVAASDAGDYNVVVTGDCGIAISTPVILTVNPAPAAPTIAAGSATAFCAGGNVVLTSSAATGNQWFKDGTTLGGATGQTYTATTSGSYTVKTIAGSCTPAASAATVVTVTPTPATPTITATGNILTSSATAGNQWFLNGVAIQGATGQTHRVQASGIYTVRVTQNGCSATSVAYNFVATRIDNPEVENNSIAIYPNPVVKQLVVKNQSGHPLFVQLFDSFGKRVYNGKLVGSQNTIDVQGLNAGMYQVRITDLNQSQTITQSIIKL